jgi:AraC-like DNA-binding protein
MSEIMHGYLSPQPKLAPYIKYYFYIRAKTPIKDGVYSFEVFPEPGLTLCHIMSGECANPEYRQYGSENEKTFLIGASSGYRWMEVSGDVDIWGTVFHADQSYKFIDCSADEISNFAISDDDIQEKIFTELCEKIYSVDDIYARKALVEDALLKKLESTRVATDPYITPVLTKIRKNPAGITLEALEKFTGLSRRQIERKFSNFIGLSPKIVVRMQRFFHATSQLNLLSKPKPDWANIALNSGYYDQSHFIGEFKKLTGLSPQKFFSSGGMSHFSNPKKGPAGRD